jgi:hypothetical protein
MSLLRRHDAAWRSLLASTPGRLGLWGLVMLLSAGAAAVLAQHWRGETAAWAARARAVALPAPVTATEWPAATAHAARVRTLLGLARHHGVQVRAMRDDSGRDAAGSTAKAAEAGPRWRGLAMTVEGRYGAVRGFVASARAADPTLALDSLVLQRPDAQATLLRAELAWAFGSAAPGSPR